MSSDSFKRRLCQYIGAQHMTAPQAARAAKATQGTKHRAPKGRRTQQGARKNIGEDPAKAGFSA